MKKKVLSFNKSRSAFEKVSKDKEMLVDFIIDDAKIKAGIISEMIDQSMNMLASNKSVTYKEVRLNEEDLSFMASYGIEDMEDSINVMRAKGEDGSWYRVYASVEFSEDGYEITTTVHRFRNGMYEISTYDENENIEWMIAQEFLGMEYIIADDLEEYVKNRDVEAAFIQMYLDENLNIFNAKQDMSNEIRKILDENKALVELMKLYPNNFDVVFIDEEVYLFPYNWDDINGIAFSCTKGRINLHQHFAINECFDEDEDYDQDFYSEEDDDEDDDWSRNVIVDSTTDIEKVKRFINMYCLKEYGDEAEVIIPISFESVAIKNSEGAPIITSRDIRSLSGHTSLTDSERNTWKETNAFIKSKIHVDG